MAYSVVEILNNQMPTIQKSVDLTLSTLSSNGSLVKPGMPDPALDQFFPMQSYLSLKIALLRMEDAVPTLAYLVGTDGKIPVDTAPVSLSTQNLGRLKIGKARQFTEKDFEAMYEIQMMMSTAPQAAMQLLDHYMQSPVRMTMGLYGLMRLMAIRIACTGKALYVDPVTELPATSLDYTAQIPATNLPAAKTGNGRWSQTATATPIQDLVDHANAYFANTKRWPAYVVMGRKAAQNLRLANSTKEILARTQGIITDSVATNSTSIGNITAPTLSQISANIAQQLTGDDGASPNTMQIIVSESTWQIRTKAGVDVSGNYIPDDYYFFATPGYIEEAVTPIASNKFAGGVSVQTEVLQKEPPVESLTVATGFIPLCVDPRMIAARNVENTVSSIQLAA